MRLLVVISRDDRVSSLCFPGANRIWEKGCGLLTELMRFTDGARPTARRSFV